MAKIVYLKGFEQLLRGAFGDLQTAGKLKLMLVNQTYRDIADETKRDTHLSRADLTAYEISGIGYTAGGQAAVNVLVSIDTATNTIKLTSDPFVWPSSTINTSGAALYFNSGVASTDTLIAFLDIYGSNGNAPLTSTNGTLTLTPPAGGLYTLNPNTGS